MPLFNPPVTNVFGIPGLDAIYATSIYATQYGVTTGGNVTVPLYTVPSGRFATLNALSFFNKSAINSTNFNPLLITTTPTTIAYTGTTASTSALTNTATTSILSMWGPGETIGVRFSGTPDINVFPSIIEFEAPRLKLINFEAFAVGDNTVYTVPAGKRALLFSRGFWSTTSPTLSVGALFINISGGAVTASFYIVPLGQTPGINYQAGPTGSISNNTLSTVVFPSTVLQAGDFIVVNTSSASVGQIFRTFVVEY